MMGTVSGCLALALLGAEPAPMPQSAQPRPIDCQARVMTVDALDWRTTLGDRLTSVSRQGGATVWVAHRSVQPSLLAMAGDRIAQASTLRTEPEATATAMATRTISYVERLKAVQLQHPVVALFGTFPALAGSGLQIKQAQVEEKFEVRCSGKRLDQGLLTRVRLVDSHLAALHKAPVPVEAEGGEFDFNILRGTAPSGLDLFLDLAESAVDTRLPVFSPLNLVRLATEIPASVEVVVDEQDPAPAAETQVEIPEVVSATVEGEWLVPADSVLVVSLGVHTGADAQGKAVIRDRVAILDFSGKTLGPVTALWDHAARPAGSVVRACESADSTPTPTPIALSHLNMPAVPDRSLPEAIDKDGQVVDLPPLPEAYAAADLNQISPGTPLASAQSPTIRPSGPAADPQLARTSFEATCGGAVAQKIGVDCHFDRDGQFCQALTIEPVAAPQPARLAQLVEGFLRCGMGTCPGDACTSAPKADANCADEAGDCPECPAARACPAQGSAPGGPEAAPADPTKFRASFAAALQNPGTTETQFIPLGKGLALEVRVRVVPEPKGDDDQARASKPRRVEELITESEKVRQAGDDWQRFWFLDQPSHMMPFRAQGNPQP